MRFRLTLLMVVAMVGSLVGQIAVVPAWAQGQEPPAVDEIVVDDQRYQFDQTVPIDVGTLQQVADADGTPVYTKPSDDPLGAVYTPGDTGARRYLPENLDAPQAVCAVATADVGQIEGAGFVYVPTGIEPDLAPEQLVEVGSTADGRTLYAPSTEQPFEQLYVSGADGGVVRYIAIGENGVPVTFPDRMIFAGQEFQLTAGETPDPSGFQQVGCALRFPALAAPGETPGAFTAVHVQAGDSLVTYRSVGPTEPATPAATEPPIAPVATEPQEPTVAPTVAPTEAPTVAPTETPVPTVAPTETPEPTVAPTDTPVPTAVPTETPEPTAVPTETPVPTVAPTETPLPTAVPTETPVPTETSEPTAAPTDTPAPTAAPTETPVPAAPPTETPEPAQAPQETQAPTPRPTPTPQVLQPRAVVPTLPPDAPPPPAATSAVAGCTGEAGPIGADGLPERLPEAFQYGGTGYRFAETVPIDELDDLDRIGCIGPFEVYDVEGETLYLTLSTIAESAWRYELTASFTVDLEVTDDPRLLILQGEDGDVRYRAGEPLVRSIYSSVSLILYVPDAEATQPARVLGYAVDHEVFGEYLPEGEAEPASQEVQERAEAMGIHPTMTIGTGTQTYVLVTLWEPFGTTTNGWLTLYAPAGEETPEQLVGIDPRRLDLPVFNRQ